jgi:hypothetical protein
VRTRRDPRLLLFSPRGYANETLREQEVGDLGNIIILLDYFATIRMVIPSGSLTRKLFLNHNVCPGIVTTAGEINLDPFSLNRSAIAATSLTTKVVYQWLRSLEAYREMTRLFGVAGYRYDLPLCNR